MLFDTPFSRAHPESPAVAVGLEAVGPRSLSLSLSLSPILNVLLPDPFSGWTKLGDGYCFAGGQDEERLHQIGTQT